MSSEHSLPGSDLRGAAQDYKRDAEHKAKWATGTRFTRGRGEANPRPRKTSEICKPRHFARSAAVTSFGGAKAKIPRKQDMLAAGEEFAVSSEESGNSCESDNGDNESAATPADANVIYSFDAARSPGHGSQILNTALAKAIEQYEDKETIKIVRNEYEVIEDDSHALGMASTKPRILDAEDAEYEFV